MSTYLQRQGRVKQASAQRDKQHDFPIIYNRYTISINSKLTRSLATGDTARDVDVGADSLSL